MTIAHASSVLLFTVSSVMWFKLIEMLWHMIRVYPQDSVAGGTSTVDVIKEWPITALIARIALVLPKFLRPYLFRFSILVIALILLLFLSTPGPITAFAGVAMYSAIWIHLLRILIDQVKYGSGVYLRGPAIPNPLFVRKFGGELARQKLGAFLYLFLGQCGTVVLGFAALFYVCHCESTEAAFVGIPKDGWPAFHFVYFSIVTLATVGYGDVAPAQLVLPRFLVASEIVAGFLILVALVASVSLTFQSTGEETTLKPPS